MAKKLKKQSDVKKELILNYVLLGIDLYEAAILAECTPDEVTQFENDKEFMARCEYEKLVQEVDLRELYDMTVRAAANDPKKFDHRGVRDYLELLRPEKYSKNQKEQNKIPLEVNLTFTNVRGKK